MFYIKYLADIAFFVSLRMIANNKLIAIGNGSFSDTHLDTLYVFNIDTWIL